MERLGIKSLRTDGGTQIDQTIVDEYVQAQKRVEAEGGTLLEYLSAKAIFADFTYLRENQRLADQIATRLRQLECLPIIDRHPEHGLVFHSMLIFGQGPAVKPCAEWFRNKPSISIYFIQSARGGPIKIGMTAGQPLHRMASLQTGFPYELRLLGVISDADDSREAEIHQQFSHLRIRGEWFRPAPDLLDFILTEVQR